MDIALIVDKLVPGAKYSGSLTANTQAAYNAVVWTDERPKPTWAAIQAADEPNLGKNQLELLTEIFTTLPVEAQAQFGTLASAVFLFVSQNNPAAAQLLIQGTPVPENLEGVKTQLLEVFES